MLLFFCCCFFHMSKVHVSSNRKCVGIVEGTVTSYLGNIAAKWTFGFILAFGLTALLKAWT